ncbi:unnamed protein product [Durusdinium trenchii]|uniref:Uncharacterized protein n=2 Tax=Durusdinium trenchii TaxID=1381693 RepID=A0ABP0SJK6_9DINO
MQPSLVTQSPLSPSPRAGHAMQCYQPGSSLPFPGQSARTYFGGMKGMHPYASQLLDELAAHYVRRECYSVVLPGYSPGGFYGHGAQNSLEKRRGNIPPPEPRTRKQRSSCC